MKFARALLATDKVLSSNFAAPILKGVVQEGTTSYRAGLVLKSGMDLENLCTCRASREWGTICAHSVAVGLHWLRPPQLAKDASLKEPQISPSPATTRLRRAVSGDANAEPIELHIILPPNFAEAASRGKVMLVLSSPVGSGSL